MQFWPSISYRGRRIKAAPAVKTLAASTQSRLCSLLAQSPRALLLLQSSSPMAAAATSVLLLHHLAAPRRNTSSPGLAPATRRNWRSLLRPIRNHTPPVVPIEMSSAWSGSACGSHRRRESSPRMMLQDPFRLDLHAASYASPLFDVDLAVFSCRWCPFRFVPPP